MKEVWKDIAGYEGLYQVSNLGRVKSLERYKQNHSKEQLVEEKIKAVRVDVGGYLIIDLYKENKGKTCKVHRLVAEAFIPNPQSKQTVNHIDGNKQNNCVDNLEWATFKEQNEHFYKHHLKSEENIKKAINAMSEATSKKVICKNDGTIYTSVAAAARAVGVSASLVSKCCKGKCKSAGKDKKNQPINWAYL